LLASTAGMTLAWGETGDRNDMQRSLLRSKLHKASVTGAELDYVGSLTIDRALMDAVDIVPFEKILVANLENGERFETYAIPADPGSGQIILNGATAHKGSVGDRLIIFTFALLDEDEIRTHKPKVLILDAQNRPAEMV
jgi:aspartate 1-decarboxylase